MDLSTILSALAVVAAIGFPLLARRDLITKLEARDTNREEWRKDVKERLEKLETVPYRLQQLEKHHAEYKDWKHERADPYILDYTNLEKRLQRVERYLNGKLSP